jgi:DNA-binding YbaB/EbfC family protein
MASEPDLGKLLQQAQEMQQQLVAAQAEAAEEEVEGQAGGGAVKVRVTGGMAFRAVRIAPEAVDPDDVEMLEDLVLAALHDAVAKAQELQQGALGALGSLGLGDLGGLLGQE